MLFIGVFFMFIGFLLSLTIIGAVIGIPIMIFGSFFIIAGVFRRRKTVITNVIQVTNAPQMPAPAPEPQRAPQPVRYVETPATPKAIEASQKACASCNTDNVADSRFCINCGTPFPLATA